MLTFHRAQIVALLFLCVVAFVTGCEKPSHKDPSKITVVSTVGMINDAVRIVGGDSVEAIGLMGPGVDPHLYRATADDVRKLDRADVLFYGGLELEGRMTEILEKLPNKGKTVVAVTDDIDRSLLREPPLFKTRYDPHVWFDVTLWKTAVRTIAKTLAEEVPHERQAIQKRADAYLAELDELHAYVESRSAELEPDSRVLITAHDAFGYFGLQYGFDVLAVQGTSTAAEASAMSIIKLADTIAERKVKAVFIETSVPRATIVALQKSVRSKGWNVAIGPPLYSDALGDDGTPEGTYVGMVRHNIDAIVDSLK